VCPTHSHTHTQCHTLKKMKNLVIVSELLHAFPFTSTSSTNPDTGNGTGTGDVITIVCQCFNLATAELLLLTSNGLLITCQVDECVVDLGQHVNLNDHLQTEDGEDGGSNSNNDKDNTWFHVSFVSETNSVVCVSHTGNIVRIQRSGDVDHEGCVDGGIGCVGWSPDQTTLILATGNNTLLAMSNQFDVIQEVPMIAAKASAGMSIAWCESGDLFALSSLDNDDGIARVRIYNKDLELGATVRNIADGPAMTVKGINSSCLAFANNGSLIAFPLERVKGKHQVAFSEKNGLRHGEFDIHLPASATEWRVWSIHWDLTTTLLAVGFESINAIGDPQSYVHVYYRGNYHWYLKQQFSGAGLRSLGFDMEMSNRLYLTQTIINTDNNRYAAIRVVDLVWDVTRSATTESSVAVVDGAQILLSPLGICNVPPPMSSFQVKLPQPCIDSHYWPVDLSNAPKEGAVWGLSCLCDGNQFSIIFGNARGSPIGQLDVDLNAVLEKHGIVGKNGGLLSANNAIMLRNVVSIQGKDQSQSNKSVKCVFVGCSLCDTEFTRNERDVLLVITIDTTDGSIVASELKSGFDGTIARIERWEDFDDASIGVGVNSPGGFQVQRISLAAGDEIVEVLESVDIPERCEHFLVVPASAPTTAAVTEDHHNTAAVLALSSRHRLYCGETLVMSGVTTMAINPLLNMVLYITLGTRPHLHFVSTKVSWNSPTHSICCCFDSMHCYL
jgi:hypothetical protein